MSEREPLILEQVAVALGLQLADIQRDSQRAALGLVKATERPAWCTDKRITFFDAASVVTAAIRRFEERDRLKQARAGVLPPSWSGFKPVPQEREANLPTK